MSAGARVWLGFILVAVLIAIVFITGMVQLNSINNRVNQFIYNDAIKVDLVHKMISAVHVRTTSLYNLSYIADVFDQDEEYMHFSEVAGRFLKSRDTLLEMNLDDKEKDILEQVRVLAAGIKPKILETIDLSIAGNGADAQENLNKNIRPEQRKIVKQLEQLLIIQEAKAKEAVSQAEISYSNAWWTMAVLCSVLGLIGMSIIVVVVRLTNKQADMLQHQALYDSLTGLPNRTLFTDRLQQTILSYKRADLSFVLIAVDLNKFKEINDTLGHQAGDDVLKNVARIGSKCLRESDTLARMGGDEFAILLPSAQTIDGAVIVAKRLIKKFREPISIQGHELEVSASLGIAIFPGNTDNIDELQKFADVAMYQAKNERSGYAVYSEEMDEKDSGFSGLQSELRKAITREELVLHYQPKIEFATRSVSGVEALVRWQHPARGLLPPDEFIPFAENSVLIRPITEYVLRKATKQAADWLTSGQCLTVAVNVSAINIQDEKFAAKVQKILDEAKLPAEFLELELTESAVMSKPEKAIKCIQQLHDLGVQVSIDDFGTGYTSISQLKGLLVTKIKIDRSFVKNMAVNHSDAVIVRATIDLSHNLGFKVVAEGVENQATWDQLENMGCDSAQGFHMGKPLSPQAFADWLKNSPWGNTDKVD